MSEDLKKYGNTNVAGLSQKRIIMIMMFTILFACIVMFLMDYTGIVSLDYSDLYLIFFIVVILCVVPAFGTIIFYMRRQSQNENKLLLELVSEEERYRLAFENSTDIIFEYDYLDGSLSCYGNFDEVSGLESSNGKLQGTFEGIVLSEGYVHYDDIQKIVDFKQGKSNDNFSIRLRSDVESQYKWYMVEGTIVSDHEVPMKLIGKLRDINEEKQQEKDFIENAKKDGATDFFTWEVGKKLIESQFSKKEVDTRLMFFKLMNIDNIDEDYGQIFADAIIVHVANVLKSCTRDEDYLIRVSRASFVAMLPEISQDGMMMMHTGIERQLEHMYTGAGNAGGLDYIIRFMASPHDLYNVVMSENTEDNVPGDKAAGIRYDTVSFAFNILEHTKDLNSAMGMLLEYVGTQFNIACIHVMEKEDAPGIETCIYEWRSGPMLFGNHPGERRELDHLDLDNIYRELKLNDFIVTDSHMLSSCTEETRVRMLRNHTSHLFVAMISGGEPIGLIDYEHLNSEYKWPDETSATLNEVTRVISTYILKNKSDNASRAKSDFLSSMSHEIRTPMNAITGFSELILAEDGLNDNARRYAGDIKSSAESLLAIINDILDFSKIEAGKFEIIPENYRLSSVLNDVYSIIKVRLGEKGVVFNINLEGYIPDGLIGDSSRVKQVLLNILNNAVKFTHKGRITLSVRWEEGEENSGTLLMAVKDTGIGIKEEDIGRIFESFSQVDIVRNKSIKGTGLGLAICKNLLNLMGGGIKAESVYGEGTTFSFYVGQKVFDNKKCEFDPENFKRQDNASFVVPFSAPEARVLIVDDNRVNLEVAKGLLRQYKVNIETALSGEEALDIVYKDPDFDIIFMDHMMPKMDGIETTAHIRHRETDKTTPIIALTANAIKGADKLFLDAGMNDYISKPINLKQLAKIMERWVPDNKKIFDTVDPDSEEKDQAGTKTEPDSEIRESIDNAGDEFSVLSGIDLSAGLANCLDDRGVYKNLLETFIDSDAWNNADGFYRDRDFENYKISVHGLKSSANYIGAVNLSNYARQLEDFAKDGDIESIDANHAGLEPLYNEVAVSIRALLNKNSSAPDLSNVQEVEDSEIKKLLEKLLTELDDMDLDAASQSAKKMVEMKSDNSEINSILNDMCRDIDNFDFDEAHEKAEKLVDMI